MSSLLVRSISLDRLIVEFYVDSGHLMCFSALLPWDRHRRLELASLPYHRFPLEVIKGFMLGLWRPRMMRPSDPQAGHCEARPINHYHLRTRIHRAESAGWSLIRYRTPSVFFNFIVAILSSSPRASFVSAARSQSLCASRTATDEAAIRRFLLKVIKGYARRERRCHPQIDRISVVKPNPSTNNINLSIYMRLGFQS
jgi:hypothetical protein